jgi:hypothetical protein
MALSVDPAQRYEPFESHTLIFKLFKLHLILFRLSSIPHVGFSSTLFITMSFSGICTLIQAKYLYGFIVSHAIIVLALLSSIITFPDSAQAWSPFTLSIKGQPSMKATAALLLINAFTYGILFIPSLVLHVQAFLVYLAARYVLTFVRDQIQVVRGRLAEDSLKTMEMQKSKSS